MTINENLYPTHEDYDGLRRIAEYTNAAAHAKGFGEEGDLLRLEVTAAEIDGDKTKILQAKTNLRNYYGNRLMLIVGEIAEAHEELRLGKDFAERYYSGEPFTHDDDKFEGKPEGVPSELADVVIRAFNLAYEANIDLASVIEEKLAYNATRPRMHGKKF